MGRPQEWMIVADLSRSVAIALDASSRVLAGSREYTQKWSTGTKCSRHSGKSSMSRRATVLALEYSTVMPAKVARLLAADLLSTSCIIVQAQFQPEPPSCLLFSAAWTILAQVTRAYWHLQGVYKCLE